VAEKKSRKDFSKPRPSDRQRGEELSGGKGKGLLGMLESKGSVEERGAEEQRKPLATIGRDKEKKCPP